MAVHPVAGHRAKEGKGQKQEANHLIPQGVKGFDDPWHDMPDKIDAVLYKPALGHVLMVPKSAGTLISGQLPVDRRVIAALPVGWIIKKRSLGIIAQQVGLVKYDLVHYNGDGFQKVELPRCWAHPLDRGHRGWPD